MSAIILAVDDGEPFRATFESQTLLNEQIIELVIELFSFSDIARESMILNAMPGESKI